MKLVAIWLAVVVGLMVRAYPELLAAGPRRAPFARADHPVPHLPVHASAAIPPVLTAPTFQYRGDAHHTGIASGTLDIDSLRLAFEHHDENVGIHDASKSSPAVDDSGVYVGFDTGQIVAFDHDGTRRWQFDVAQAARGVHATAALDATRLYLGAYNGTLYALDKQSGAASWVLRLGDTIGSSVAVVDDALYVAVETFSPPDGYVAKLDRRTGEIRWQSGWLGEQAHSTPTVSSELGLVFVGANNGVLRALSVDDGTERWRLACDGAIKGTVALDHGVLAFGTMGGSLYAVDARTGGVRWQRALGGKTRSSATVVGDAGLVVIGADDGTLAAFDLDSGQRRWALATDQHPYPASATAVRDANGAWVLLAPCDSKTLCVVSAVGVVIRRFELGADLTGTPTVWNGSLYLSSDRHGGLTGFDQISRP